MSAASLVRMLEEDIFQLCERVPDKQTALEKQRLYSRVGQFLMGSFDGHWWCKYPTLMTFMVRILELHPGPDSVRMFYDKMAQQLGLCSKCVDIYHSAMPSVRVELENEFTPTSVKAFFHKVSQLDAERIQSVFAPVVPRPSSLSPSTLNVNISTALYEILTNRRLWSDFRIIRVVSKWLGATPEPIKDAAIDKDMILRSCPGILQWLVSPDPGIRAWATSLVGKHGIVVDMSTESSDGRAWMKVLDEWMYILESGSFNTSLLNLDLPSTEELPMFLDATNCVKTPTNQILWAALDTIMQRMNANSLEALLESFDNLPDLVFNYLNDAEPATTNPQITFVICKCYGSLMRCLGHRYWNHTVHSPKVVLDLVLQHCLLPSWRVFVTKQLIDLLPPLLVSMRPPVKSTNERNERKLLLYFEARSRVLKVLLHQDHRPAHFNDQVLCVAASKTVSAIICDCYEPRLTSVTPSSAGAGEQTKRDDGALPEMSLVDLSVIESSFWWPCGPGYEDIEQMWISHLFRLLVNPENVVALVDHVATSCSTVLSKHLSLAREVVYTLIKSSDRSTPLSSVLPKKPIVTRLVERLCSWNVIATIPIAVHGALFECIGGVAELLNLIEAQQQPSDALTEFKATLKNFESLVCGGYLERICGEVFVKGLTNPIRFPIVAQHLTVCLLSPTSQVDQQMKRLLANAGANKATPDRVPPPLESLLVVVHRNTEAYLRGALNLLQGWRLHDFPLTVLLPTVKKVIFTWTKMFEMLGNDLRKAMEASSESANQLSQDDTLASNSVNLQKIPVLMGDFMARLLSDLYGSTRPAAIEESVLIQCLDFGNTFWRFFSKEDKPLASSKRFEGMISPLVRCVESIGGQAEKPRAAELLMTVLEGFVEGQTRVNDSAISTLETIKSTTTANIKSRKSTDFARVANKLRQVSKATRFFAPRPIKAQRGSRLGLEDRSGKTRQGASARNDDAERSADSLTSGNRPMSAKGAAREQARLAAARSAASTIFEASSKKAHSFYDEDDFATARTTPTKRSSAATDSRAKPFDISQVVKGMEQTRPGARRSMHESGRAGESGAKPAEEDEEEEEEEEDSTNLAPLFFKIKNTQKAIPNSPLAPFFRHLLQVCIPALLTKEFQTERNDRELLPPSLTFSKSSEYANAFLPLLLEECHNEVQEGLRRCYFSSGKSGHLLRYESEKTREGMRCLNFSVVEGNAGSADKSRPGNKFFWHQKLFRNYDVVLLQSVGNRQNAGNMDFIGVVIVSENDKGKRRQGRSNSAGASGGQGGKEGPQKDDQELVRIMFLNDGELESVTSEIPTFQMEALTANAIADTEWRVTTLSNLVTSSREYIALRSVDMFPEHFRTTILTPNMYETTQTELLKITTAVDELRAQKSGQSGVDRKILKLLKRLDTMELTLTEIRSTTIAKTVNKLRKHDNAEIKDLSSMLREKWSALLNKKDALDVAPRYVSAELWDTIKGQYNKSQLQSIHSVLNNYTSAISLLQGPPGTGKTKTIMGLLSGFLTLKIPPAAVIPQSARIAESAAVEKPKESPMTEPGAVGGFSKFDLVREIAAKQGRTGNATFSLSGTAASSRILRHSDDGPTHKQTAIQALRSTGNARSRLENKMNGSKPSSAALVRRTLLGPSVLSMRSREASSSSSNVLLCAPSNGAVDELVLRIVTHGLLDRNGKETQVRAPSVHPDANTNAISIVRLGNPGEDAPDAVKAVCLPHIIKHELSVHPKTIELRNLQDQERTLRGSIKDFYDKKQEEKPAEGEDKDAQRTARRGLAKTHANLTQVKGQIRRLRDEVSALEAKMTAAILSSASIIACTLSKAGSGQFDGLQRGFDALIVDEAAQAVELSTLIPIRERVARAVLVGDPKQLPATVKSVAAANALFNRSLFERISDSGVAPSMLQVQYRMHPFLREFPSKQFYGGMLSDGPTVMEGVNRSCGDLYKKPYFQPFLLYDLIDTKESDSNGSKYNRAEAAFCVDLCASLFEICPDLRAKKWSVGFVSPYREQVGTIRKEINSCSKLPVSLSIEVNTVDGFQGREKDVIIFSCVRASDRGGIGFLKDTRRLNVAITRAKFCLFVVGSVRTLRRDETWNALVRSAQERKLVIQARASKGFAGVKEELDRDERNLKAHFKEMHAKLVSKAPSVAAPQADATTAESETKTDTKSKTSDGIAMKSKGDASDGDKPDQRDGTSKESLAGPTGQDVARSKRDHEALPASQPVEKKIRVDQTELKKSEESPRSTELPSRRSAGSAQPPDHSTSSSSVSPSTRPSPSVESKSASRSVGDRPSIDRRESGLKRPAPVLARDLEPIKSFRATRDDRRRSRSRSRDRLSSASRDRPSSASRDRPSSGNRERPPSIDRDRPPSASRERPSSSSRTERPLSASRDRPSSTHRQDGGRGRSRSRERPSSAPRRQDADRHQVPVPPSHHLADSTRHSRPDAQESSRDERPGGVREQERSAEQKHVDRQARLRALRESASERASSNGPRAPVGTGSGRIVQLVRSGSRDGSSADASRSSSGAHSGRGGGSLLSSILGSSKQLTQSTSRVDLANARRDHTT